MSLSRCGVSRHGVLPYQMALSPTDWPDFPSGRPAGKQSIVPGQTWREARPGPHRPGYAPYLEQEEPLKIECRHILDCIQHGTQPLSSGARGLELVKILEVSPESWRQNGAAVLFPRNRSADLRPGSIQNTRHRAGAGDRRSDRAVHGPVSRSARTWQLPKTLHLVWFICSGGQRPEGEPIAEVTIRGRRLIPSIIDLQVTFGKLMEEPQQKNQGHELRILNFC